MTHTCIVPDEGHREHGRLGRVRISRSRDRSRLRHMDKNSASRRNRRSKEGRNRKTLANRPWPSAGPSVLRRRKKRRKMNARCAWMPSTATMTPPPQPVRPCCVGIVITHFARSFGWRSVRAGPSSLPALSAGRRCRTWEASKAGLHVLALGSVYESVRF